MTVWLLAALALTADASPTWNGFRGPGDSVTAAVGLPLEWSDTKNIAWRIELPGYGQSSPVVWGSQAFVTSITGEEKEHLWISAVDLATGKIAWKQEFAGTQKVKDSDYVSRAAPTPCVDAERVYALFESGDVVALDHQGKLAWQRSLVQDYGKIEGAHGLGSSLAQSAESLLVLVDHEGQSYLAAISKRDGKTLWKVDRPTKTSWTSPVVIQRGAAEIVLTSGAGRVEAYDAKTGAALWFVTGLEKNTVPSPTPAGDLVIIGSSEVGSNIAIRLGGTGDVTATHVVWRSSEQSSTFSSPLVYRDRVYYVNRAGVAFCSELATGKVVWKGRLAGSCWCSPIASEDRIYFFTKAGTTSVLATGDSEKVLAENPLAVEGTLYGVAVIPKAFVIRFGRELICVKQPDE